jgi:hypothetical protein
LTIDSIATDAKPLSGAWRALVIIHSRKPIRLTTIGLAAPKLKFAKPLTAQPAKRAIATIRL